jgi:hypothetical protein
MSYASLAQLREYLPQVPERAAQRVTVTGSPTGGTFTLSYEGVASGTIAHNARAATVKTALNAVSTINGDVATVSGPAGGPWVVTFKNTVANDASPLVLGTNSLTGGTAPSVAIEPATDDVLQAVLDRATQVLDTAIGYSFTLSASASQVVYGDGTAYLVPTACLTVSGVTAPTGYDIPDYVLRDGMLILTDSAGVLVPEAYAGRSPVPAWREGVPYTVAGTFGYAAVPDDIVEACLEVAARIWRGRSSGFSDVIGVEGGGAVGYEKAFPAMVRHTIGRYRAKRYPGVW